MNFPVKTISLSGVELFCAAASSGSFTLAANALGLTPAAVSRAVKRLEQRLNVPLFIRSTRKIALSDEGRAYYEVCQAALSHITDAGQRIQNQRNAPQGELRISVGAPYAHYRLIPNLATFNALYPKIRLHINISNRNIDFIDDGYDVAIRLGRPIDSGLQARKLEDARIGLFASEAYVKQHGTPSCLDELAAHEQIGFLLPSSGKVFEWLLAQDSKILHYAPKLKHTVSDDPLGCVALAQAGLGISQTFHWVANKQTPPLCELLSKHNTCTRPFYALFAASRQTSTKVRVLLDFLSSLDS